MSIDRHRLLQWLKKYLQENKPIHRQPRRLLLRPFAWADGRLAGQGQSANSKRYAAHMMQCGAQGAKVPWQCPQLGSPVVDFAARRRFCWMVAPLRICRRDMQSCRHVQGVHAASPSSRVSIAFAPPHLLPISRHLMSIPCVTAPYLSHTSRTIESRPLGPRMCVHVCYHMRDSFLQLFACCWHG